MRRRSDRHTYWQKVKSLSRALQGDGCTCAPDFFYRECCDEHDIHYRTGKRVNGDPITRLQADNALFRCMRRRGKLPVIGKLLIPAVFWLFVRALGWKAWRG